MSNNPFARFVVDPSKVVNPNTIQAREFQNYTSLEMQKMQQSLKTYKRSAVYIGGCLALMAVYAVINNSASRNHVLGDDNQGGKYLDVKTTHNEASYAYNREFQRMMVMSQSYTADVPRVSERLLADLGVKPLNNGSHYVPKKAPHEKFY